MAITAATLNRYTLTSTSPTALSNLQSTPGVLFGIENTGSTLSVFLQLFDEGTPQGLAANRIHGDGVAVALSGGQVLSWPHGIRLYSGLSYSLSGALPAGANVILLVQ